MYPYSQTGLKGGGTFQTKHFNPSTDSSMSNLILVCMEHEAMSFSVLDDKKKFAKNLKNVLKDVNEPQCGLQLSLSRFRSSKSLGFIQSSESLGWTLQFGI